MFINCPKIQNSQKGNALVVILVVILIFIIGLGAALGFYYTKTKSELAQLSEKQVKELKKINAVVEDAIDLNKNLDMDSETNSHVLGVSVNSEGEVKGLEDTDLIRDARKEKQLYSAAKESLGVVKKQNDEAKKLANKIRLKNTPILDTEKYVSEAEPLFNYLQQGSQLGIELVTQGVELGSLIQNAILRGADETSVRQYSEALESLSLVKEQLANMDISQLPQDMQEEHTSAIETFDKDLEVFYEIETALKEKNGQKLEAAIQSMVLSSATGMETSTTIFISFLEDNTTMQRANSLSKEWQTFADDLK
jgi:hypothetical protein